MPQLSNLVVRAIARRASLKTCPQMAIATGQLTYQPLNRCRLVRDLANKPYLALAPTFRDHNRMLQLSRIKRDVHLAIPPHGPSSMPEARLGPSEQPSIIFDMKGRPTGLNQGDNV